MATRRKRIRLGIGLALLLGVLALIVVRWDRPRIGVPPPAGQILLPVTIDGRWGAIDLQGELVIPAAHDRILFLADTALAAEDDPWTVSDPGIALARREPDLLNEPLLTYSTDAAGYYRPATWVATRQDDQQRWTIQRDWPFLTRRTVYQESLLDSRGRRYLRTHYRQLGNFILDARLIGAGSFRRDIRLDGSLGRSSPGWQGEFPGTSKWPRIAAGERFFYVGANGLRAVPHENSVVWPDGSSWAKDRFAVGSEWFQYDPSGVATGVVADRLSFGFLETQAPDHFVLHRPHGKPIRWRCPTDESYLRPWWRWGTVIDPDGRVSLISLQTGKQLPLPGHYHSFDRDKLVESSLEVSPSHMARLIVMDEVANETVVSWSFDYAVLWTGGMLHIYDHDLSLVNSFPSDTPYFQPTSRGGNLRIATLSEPNPDADVLTYDQTGSVIMRGWYRHNPRRYSFQEGLILDDVVSVVDGDKTAVYDLATGVQLLPQADYGELRHGHSELAPYSEHWADERWVEMRDGRGILKPTGGWAVPPAHRPLVEAVLPRPDSAAQFYIDRGRDPDQARGGEILPLPLIESSDGRRIDLPPHTLRIYRGFRPVIHPDRAPRAWLAVVEEWPDSGHASDQTGWVASSLGIDGLLQRIDRFETPWSTEKKRDYLRNFDEDDVEFESGFKDDGALFEEPKYVYWRLRLYDPSRELWLEEAFFDIRSVSIKGVDGAPRRDLIMLRTLDHRVGYMWADGTWLWRPRK